MSFNFLFLEIHIYYILHKYGMRCIRNFKNYSFIIDCLKSSALDNLIITSGVSK